MWQVYEHENLEKVFKKLPKDILMRYEKWKDIVRVSGPSSLLKIRGFRDEKLKGPWDGYRSSRLNIQYRVIYKIHEKNLLVKVVKLTPHDYR